MHTKRKGLKMKKYFTFGVTSALIVGALLPTKVASAQDIDYSAYLDTVDISGTFTIVMNDERPITVNIVKNTPDGVISYYEETLEESGSYTFYLDSCEFDEDDTKEYISSYTVTIQDAVDVTCYHKLEDLCIYDPGFLSEEVGITITNTDYICNVNFTSITTAAEHISTESTSDVMMTDDGTYTQSFDLRLFYYDFLLGDVDDNGTVNVRDAYSVMVETANINAGIGGLFTDIQNVAADVNYDGGLTIQDAYKIMVYYSEIAAGNDIDWDYINENY